MRVTMTEPDTHEQPNKNHDDAVAELSKSLINVFIKSSQDAHGDTPLDKLKNAAKYDGNEPMWAGITALSAHRSAKAAERQAAALEDISKTVRRIQISEDSSVPAQAIIDQREPRRDYLATTYSLPTATLSLLWAMRGMLVDASIKSLSRPDRFDPYRRLTTEEIAWSLRMSPAEFYAALPYKHDLRPAIDFDLLEAFDIYHYGGTSDAPDDWMYGG